MPRIVAENRQLITNPVGSALLFNGANTSLSFGNVLSAEAIVTATMWVKTLSTPSGNYEIPFGYNNQRWFFIHPGADRDFRFGVKISGVEKAVTGTTNPSVGDWNLVTGRYDPSGGSDNLRFRIYDVNGALVQSVTSTQTGSMDTTGNSLRMGWDSGRGWYWDGAVDEIRVYTRFLSDTELDGLALHQEPNSQGLALHCKFNQIEYSVIPSSVGANGVLTGKGSYIAGVVPRSRGIAVSRLTS